MMPTTIDPAELLLMTQPSTPAPSGGTLGPALATLEKTIALPLGYDGDFPFAIVGVTLDPVTTLPADATLAAVAWPGEDLAAAFAPGVAWVDLAAGTATLSVFAAATAALDPGGYRLRVGLTTGGRTFLIHDGAIELTPSPGSGTTRKAYVSLNDLTEAADWIGKLRAPTDLAGFLAQRAQATDWADDVIQRHYRGDRGIYGGRSPDYSLDHLYFGTYRSGRASTVLQGWLDATPTRLVLDTPSGKAFRRALARKAIAFICERSLSESSEGNPYRALAAEFHAEADDLMGQITVEIDTDSDGVGDLAIELGWCDVLDG